MDSWFESPLNKAHYYDRRANNLVKKFCFDEAIDCHSSAAACLSESLKNTDNDKAKESIQLQREYHLKQQEFLRLKKLQYEQYETLKEVIRVEKEAMSRMMKVREVRGRLESGLEDEGEICLESEIYKTMEEADSLLAILVRKEEVGEVEGESRSKEIGSKGRGKTQPKDEKTVIEELRIVNYQLRTLISELVSKLSASEKEVETLRQRVKELEAENRSLAPEFVSASDYSPFVFSPDDDLPPKNPSDLPPLAPLEMPDFDLSVLRKKYSSSNNP